MERVPRNSLQKQRAIIPRIRHLKDQEPEALSEAHDSLARTRNWKPDFAATRIVLQQNEIESYRIKHHREEPRTQQVQNQQASEGE